MLKQIPKSDIIVRPLKVYKEWTLDENDISPIFGENGVGTLIDLDIDEVSNGFNKKVVYASIKSQFYNNAATASLLTEVGRRISYASTNERILENDIAVFSIPQIYYGEGIKPGTVSLEDEQLGRTYTDDGYSNLKYGNQIKGNIFYDRGLIVVAKDIVSGSVLSQFTLNFRSTKTIYENEIFLSVLENEFNYSQNPSAVIEYGGEVIKHMVTDKIHSRGSNGPIVMLTRQPSEGRARSGGLRLGEMERDCFIAHGTSNFLAERMLHVSDNYRIFVCKKCGMHANVNTDKNIYSCKYCNNNTDIAQVRMPYAFKLLNQELYTMNIMMRYICN